MSDFSFLDVDANIDTQDLTHWAKEWGRKKRMIKLLYPPHIKNKITEHKQRWLEGFEYDNIPFKDQNGRLYYFVVYKIDLKADDVGYLVLNSEGEAVPWDEAYPVAVQSRVYKDIVEDGLFWNMRQVISKNFVRHIRTILRGLKMLQTEAEKLGEVEVQQSIERLFRDYEIILEYGLLAEAGYRLGKEHVDAVLTRGYATEDDVRALYQIICEKKFFPSYRSTKVTEESEENRHYEKVKHFMWKNLWRLLVKNPFLTWGMWKYISYGTTDENRRNGRLALDSYEVHPVTKERRTFALQQEMMGEFCEYQWETSVAEAEMKVQKLLRNPKVGGGDEVAKVQVKGSPSR
ncbi:MAG: hypothetical protein KM312_00430 [Hydrogenibacillus schlegelii]|uniref:Uncharacterized protein n=1 Tax=Hydrogenibacillus schlegelii TaxID=1484 RepID=A0A947CUT2_HYDSH|nr:hypothetical protein [Hydrogenibacillus schlegelii]